MHRQKFGGIPASSHVRSFSILSSSKLLPLPSKNSSLLAQSINWIVLPSSMVKLYSFDHQRHRLQPAAISLVKIPDEAGEDYRPHVLRLNERWGKGRRWRKGCRENFRLSRKCKDWKQDFILKQEPHPYRMHIIQELQKCIKATDAIYVFTISFVKLAVWRIAEKKNGNHAQWYILILSESTDCTTPP